MNVPNDYFKISSPEIEQTKFKEITILKNLVKETIEVGIIYTEKLGLKTYQLNVQVPEPVGTAPSPPPVIEDEIPPTIIDPIGPGPGDGDGDGGSVFTRLLLEAYTDYSMENDIKSVNIQQVEHPTPEEI
jgi:hypothetical protein